MTRDIAPPTLEEIRRCRAAMGARIKTTPMWPWQPPTPPDLLGEVAVHLKLELFQFGGSFKPRGALSVMGALDAAALARGVAAISAGNHAIATAYASRQLGTHATVVMPANANPARITTCRELGATVELTDDIAGAFAQVHEICEREGRTFVHPFEGVLTARGTGTLGLEIYSQCPAADAVVVPIGGGGLCAGVAAAIKQSNPACTIYGVEPVGADTMHRSFASGVPESIERVRTIADSLGAPHAAPYSMALCRRFVDELVMVDDDDLRNAMRLLFTTAKLAVEPAGAAATAAILGPLKSTLQGRTVVSIVCGSNIDPGTFHRYLEGAGPTTDAS